VVVILILVGLGRTIASCRVLSSALADMEANNKSATNAAAKSANIREAFSTQLNSTQVDEWKSAYCR